MKYKLFFLTFLILFSFTKTNIFTDNTGNQNTVHPSKNMTNIKVMHQIGMKKYRLGLYKKALIYFKRILELKPYNNDALYNCACMNALLRKVDNTIFYLINLININRKWKIKLYNGVEKDFRFIKNHPRFILYKKYWIHGVNTNKLINHIKGEYAGTTKVDDPEHRFAKTIQFEMILSRRQLNIGSGIIGILLQGSAHKVYKHGNIFLLYATYPKSYGYEHGFCGTLLLEIKKLNKNSIKVIGGFFKKSLHSKKYERLKQINIEGLILLRNLIGEIFIKK